jgi:hypothetical protein
MPARAPTRARADGVWGSAVDHIHVLDAAGFNSNALPIIEGKIQPEHRENWAEFNTEVLTHLQHATTDLERERCYKLMILAPSLFNTNHRESLWRLAIGGPRLAHRRVGEGRGTQPGQ